MLRGRGTFIWALKDKRRQSMFPEREYHDVLKNKCVEESIDMAVLCYRLLNAILNDEYQIDVHTSFCYPMPPQTSVVTTDLFPTELRVGS